MRSEYASASYNPSDLPAGPFGRGGGQEKTSKLGPVGVVGAIWSWNTRMGGKREGGGSGICDEMWTCNASICLNPYVSKDKMRTDLRPRSCSLYHRSWTTPHAAGLDRCSQSDPCLESRGRKPAAVHPRPIIVTDQNFRLTSRKTDMLTQFNTRSAMTYPSSSTKVPASCGISTSPGGHPRAVRIRLSLANRILLFISAVSNQAQDSRLKTQVSRLKTHRVTLPCRSSSEIA